MADDENNYLGPGVLKDDGMDGQRQQLANNGYTYDNALTENGCEIWVKYDDDGHRKERYVCAGGNSSTDSSDSNNSYDPAMASGNPNNNGNNAVNPSTNFVNNALGQQNAAPQPPNPFAGFANPFAQPGTNSAPGNMPADMLAAQNARIAANAKAALASWNKVTNTDIVTNTQQAVTSSRNLVTNTDKVTGRNQINTSATTHSEKQVGNGDPNIQSHFIEEVTGKYLGTSSDFVEPTDQDKDKLTFPKLKINIRWIPKGDWYSIPKDFSHVSDPLVFNDTQVVSDFKEIVKRNKEANPVDRKNNPDEVDRNVEQCLVIYHDFKKKTITSIILPDKINSNSTVDAFTKLVLIDFYNTGNWLVPPEEWDNDLNGIPNDYYTLARKAKLIVIGFSHTHPEANFSGAGTLSRSYDVKQHSVNDFKISKNRRLPDVIIKVSVSVNKNTMARMTTVDLNLITKDALTPNDVKTLPPLEEFCKNIDYNVFNYIIKNYKDAPGK